MLLCGLHCESNRTEESLMVLTHIYTGQNSEMFVWVYVTQGHGGVHPTAELNTAELHAEAASSGLLQHSCRHTRSSTDVVTLLL